MKTFFKRIVALFCLVSLLVPVSAFANGAEMLFMVASMAALPAGPKIGDATAEVSLLVIFQ